MYSFNLSTKTYPNTHMSLSTDQNLIYCLHLYPPVMEGFIYNNTQRAVVSWAAIPSGCIETIWGSN
jgi:hypothetical protein